MKNFVFLTLALFLSIFSSCDSLINEPEKKDETGEANPEKLYVKFENSPNSTYTITGIYTLNMGVAGELPEPTGVFSENILSEGTNIAPGEFELFYVEIPNSHFAYCQIAVQNTNGTSIKLNEQEGYSNKYEGTITHWGGDDRTVTVTVVHNTNTNSIMIQSWSEWVGIE